MSIAENLITITENVPKVFKAGQLSVISQSEALKGSAQGEGITIKDISPVEHDVSVKLSGLPPIEVGGTSIPITRPYAFEDDEAQTGMTWTVADDGTITIDVDGTKTSGTAPWFIVENLVLPAGEYVLSGIQSVTAPTFEEPYWSHDIKICDGDMYRGGGDVIKNISLPLTNSTSIPDVSFTLTKETAIWIDYMYGSAGTGVSNVPDRVVTVIKPQLKADVTYISADYSDVKVQRLGKNLFNSDLTLKTQTVNGITVDNEGDGVFHFYGTATKTFTSSFMLTSIGVKIDPSKTYIVCAKLLEGKVENMNSLHPYIGLGSTINDSQNYNNASLSSTSVVGKIYSTAYPTPAIEIKSDAKYISNFWFYMYGMQQGATIDFKIQVWIIQGATKADYEPYIEPTEHTANADGTVGGIKSLYPTTILIPDTQGVIITAEYIKDIDKAFEERLAALEAATVNNE